MKNSLFDSVLQKIKELKDENKSLKKELKKLKDTEKTLIKKQQKKYKHQVDTLF